MVRRLLYLSGLAIFAVILFHAAGLGFVAMFAWRDRYTAVAAVSAVGPCRGSSRALHIGAFG